MGIPSGSTAPKRHKSIINQPQSTASEPVSLWLTFQIMHPNIYERLSQQQQRHIPIDALTQPVDPSFPVDPSSSTLLNLIQRNDKPK